MNNVKVILFKYVQGMNKSKVILFKYLQGMNKGKVILFRYQLNLKISLNGKALNKGLFLWQV